MEGRHTPAHGFVLWKKTLRLYMRCLLMFNTPACVSWKAGVQYTAVPGVTGLHCTNSPSPTPRPRCRSQPVHTQTYTSDTTKQQTPCRVSLICPPRSWIVTTYCTFLLIRSSYLLPYTAPPPDYRSYQPYCNYFIGGAACPAQWREGSTTQLCPPVLG